MGLFRIEHCNFEEVFTFDSFDTVDETEWKSTKRIETDAWIKRYEYESTLIDAIIKDNPHIKTVLEIGSGPGTLSQLIQEKHTDLIYHLIDKPNAKKYFEENDYKGEFFVKDLSSSFNTDGLLPKYDLIITNDFLEHVFNPHIIVKTIYELTDENSIYFVSNPNWRMAHQFIYRGLFDFDNIVYMMYVHKFELIGFYGSQLQTPKYPRISSETLLSDEHLFDWNHYLIFKHRDL